MPSINVSILLLALMAVSPLGSIAAPQAQVSSAKSSAAAASSAAAKSSAAAAATSIKPSTTTTAAVKPTTTSITPSSAAAKSSSIAAASSAAKSSAAASSAAAKSSSSAAAISASASKAASSSSASKAATSSSASAALTKPSGVAINAGSADATALLKLHNDFRAHYGASALTWDNNLASFAQQTSNTCKFAHSGGPNGETLAAGAGGGFNYTSGFNLWTKEAANYNWKTPGYGSSTGHFTQVVWKATTKVGCGVTQCPDKTIFTGYGPSTFLVCEYQTPGNVVGNNSSYFVTNVGTYR